jgi:hypothetical protein
MSLSTALRWSHATCIGIWGNPSLRSPSAIGRIIRFRFLGGSNRASYADRWAAPPAVGEECDWSYIFPRISKLLPFAGVILFREDFLVDRLVQTEGRIRPIEMTR